MQYDKTVFALALAQNLTTQPVVTTATNNQAQTGSGRQEADKYQVNVSSDQNSSMEELVIRPLKSSDDALHYSVTTESVTNREISSVRIQTFYETNVTSNVTSIQMVTVLAENATLRAVTALGSSALTLRDPARGISVQLLF